MHNFDTDIINRARNAKVLILGCSAGGFNLIFDLIVQLPQGFPIPVIVVIHRSRKYKSSIEELIGKKSSLRVKIAEDKEGMESGTVYFAPPDYHLLLEPEGVFSLDLSEPVLFSRPSINATFESVADVYNDKMIAVLLSGANEDGAEGICYVHNKNGLAIVQSPLCAEVKTMPEAAIARCNGVLILKDEEIFTFVNDIK